MSPCSFGIHRWGKWVYRVVEGTDHGWAFSPRKDGVPFTQEHQERTCDRCGKREMEVIR